MVQSEGIGTRLRTLSGNQTQVSRAPTSRGRRYCARDHPLRSGSVATDALGREVCLVCWRDSLLLRAPLVRRQLALDAHCRRCAVCLAEPEQGCRDGQALRARLAARERALLAWLALVQPMPV
jgi:hypothetical protein